MILLLGCSFVAQAGLIWEQKVIRLDVHPLQVEGKAAFHFKNDGTNTVDILAVRTTCGCMKASASTNQVALGESGIIDATFNYRDKTGPQRKAVAIRTSETKAVILYVEANIQSAYSVLAKRLEWSLSSVAGSGEGGHAEYEPMTCRFVNRHKTPFNLISATSSSEQFAIELTSLRKGYEYEVTVTPEVSITKPTRATMTVQTECPSELPESRSYTFTATVR